MNLGASDIRAVLTSVLADEGSGGVITVYDLDAFRKLAGEQISHFEFEAAA